MNGPIPDDIFYAEEEDGNVVGHFDGHGDVGEGVVKEALLCPEDCPVLVLEH